MISFKTTGVVVAIPRSGQFTTERTRADIEARLERGEKVYTASGGWEEPSRFGITVTHKDGERTESRHTVVRIKSIVGDQQTCDFWITEAGIGGAAFEKLLKAEAGDRVMVSGHLVCENSYWRPIVEKALRVEVNAMRERS
jgi:hypothetical protein